MLPYQAERSSDKRKERAMAQRLTGLRTTRITVETESLMVVGRAKAVIAWCPDCHAEVDVITLTQDSFSEPITAAQVQRWLGTGKLHLWQPAEGAVQICVTSLLQSSA